MSTVKIAAGLAGCSIVLPLVNKYIKKKQDEKKSSYLKEKSHKYF
jgi:hypothetical protein